MDSDELALMPAITLAEAIRQKRVSPVEVVGAVLERIGALDPQINSFVHLAADRAMAARRAEDELMRGGRIGRLFGVPATIKDMVLTKDMPTQFGSRIFARNQSDEDSPVVQGRARSSMLPPSLERACTRSPAALMPLRRLRWLRSLENSRLISGHWAYASTLSLLAKSTLPFSRQAPRGSSKPECRCVGSVHRVKSQTRYSFCVRLPRLTSMVPKCTSTAVRTSDFARQHLLAPWSGLGQKCQTTAGSVPPETRGTVPALWLRLAD